jgi:hypothetical protein
MNACRALELCNVTFHPPPPCAENDAMTPTLNFLLFLVRRFKDFTIDSEAAKASGNVSSFYESAVFADDMFGQPSDWTAGDVSMLKTLHRPD